VPSVAWKHRIAQQAADAELGQVAAREGHQRAQQGRRERGPQALGHLGIIPQTACRRHGLGGARAEHRRSLRRGDDVAVAVGAERGQVGVGLRQAPQVFGLPGGGQRRRLALAEEDDLLVGAIVRLRELIAGEGGVPGGEVLGQHPQRRLGHDEAEHAAGAQQGRVRHQELQLELPEVVGRVEPEQAERLRRDLDAGQRVGLHDHPLTEQRRGLGGAALVQLDGARHCVGGEVVLEGAQGRTLARAGVDDVDLAAVGAAQVGADGRQQVRRHGDVAHRRDSGLTTHTCPFRTVTWPYTMSSHPWQVLPWMGGKQGMPRGCGARRDGDASAPDAR